MKGRIRWCGAAWVNGLVEKHPDQVSSGGSTEKILTFWWGATLCPPELNDLALAQYVVCEMKIAAWKEMGGKTKVKQQTLETIFEYTGHLIAPTPESTPNKGATIYENTVDSLGE